MPLVSAAVVPLCSSGSTLSGPGFLILTGEAGGRGDHGPGASRRSPFSAVSIGATPGGGWAQAVLRCMRTLINSLQ